MGRLSAAFPVKSHEQTGPLPYLPQGPIRRKEHRRDGNHYPGKLAQRGEEQVGPAEHVLQRNLGIQQPQDSLGVAGRVPFICTRGSRPTARFIGENSAEAERAYHVVVIEVGRPVIQLDIGENEEESGLCGSRERIAEGLVTPAQLCVFHRQPPERRNRYIFGETDRDFLEGRAPPCSRRPKGSGAQEPGLPPGKRPRREAGRAKGSQGI